MRLKQQLTKEQVLQKLRHYCRYQPRCYSEAKNKLFELGVNKTDYDEMIKELVEENFLDERRFALAFATGKFKMKQWGRRKIQYVLKEKMVSDENIQKALGQIHEDEYTKTLTKLAKEKYSSLKNEQWLNRKKKTLDYLVQKGFEPELCKTFVEKMMNQ